MPYALRPFECASCGAQVAKRAASGAVVFCVPCGVERSAENARQIHAKEGPLYLRWLWATATWARRQGTEIPAEQGRRAG